MEKRVLHDLYCGQGRHKSDCLKSFDVAHILDNHAALGVRLSGAIIYDIDLHLTLLALRHHLFSLFFSPYSNPFPNCSACVCFHCSCLAKGLVPAMDTKEIAAMLPNPCQHRLGGIIIGWHELGPDVKICIAAGVIDRIQVSADPELNHEQETKTTYVQYSLRCSRSGRFRR